MSVGLLLFFFFKQKTAYEMRISDWSSDVCSSDLRPVHRPRNFTSSSRGTVTSTRPVDSENSAAAASTPSRSMISVSHKIGRASCRERVLSVRVDLGGRRIIKKNNNYTLQHKLYTLHT